MLQLDNLKIPLIYVKGIFICQIKLILIMPFNIFYSKINKKQRQKIIKIANFIILLSLVAHFSYPPTVLAQNRPKNTQKNLSSKTIIKKTNIPNSQNFSQKTKNDSSLVKKNLNPSTKKSLKNNQAKKIKTSSQNQIWYTRYVLVTAYSSTVDQCDSTPFITASGSHVRDGIVAANFLKFGTKIRFPEYSGDKIYVVEDRMHPRFSNRVDIWMPTRSQAKIFGVKWLKMEVLK